MYKKENIKQNLLKKSVFKEFFVQTFICPRKLKSFFYKGFIFYWLNDSHIQTESVNFEIETLTKQVIWNC